MDELKDIGVGDAVLVQTNIRLGSYTSKDFHIKATVEKATKTQLTVSGTRYLRDTGREYGSNSQFRSFSSPTSYIYALDNRYGHTDETAEYEAFKVKVDKAKQIIKVCEKVIKQVDYRSQNLDEIHEKLMQVKVHLDQIKKEKYNDTN